MSELAYRQGARNCARAPVSEERRRNVHLDPAGRERGPYRPCHARRRADPDVMTDQPESHSERRSRQKAVARRRTAE